MKPKARKTLDSRFQWELTTFDYPEPIAPLGTQIRYAREDELTSIANLWRRSISQEEGSPWEHLLRLWTPKVVERWFRHHHEKHRARTLVAEKEGEIIGVSGPLFKIGSGIGRIFAGVVVAPEQRNQGVGSTLLYRALLELKEMGCRQATVETLHDITASKHLYPKFGGMEIVRHTRSKKKSQKKRSKSKMKP